MTNVVRRNPHSADHLDSRASARAPHPSRHRHGARDHRPDDGPSGDVRRVGRRVAEHPTRGVHAGRDAVRHAHHRHPDGDEPDGYRRLQPQLQRQVAGGRHAAVGDAGTHPDPHRWQRSPGDDLGERVGSAGRYHPVGQLLLHRAVAHVPDRQHRDRQRRRLREQRRAVRARLRCLRLSHHRRHGVGHRFGEHVADPVPHHEARAEPRE